jgi:hypothetical protein
LTSLPSKLESFITTMKEGEEFERRGFDLLAKRPRPEEYFDALAQAGFFEASNNPGPVPTQPGFVHVPYWTPLNYLEAVARRAGELNDLALANKILQIVRSVTTFRDTDGSVRDNHYTFWKFAEFVAVLPTQSVSNDDAHLAKAWISSKFDRGLVARTLGSSVIGRFLDSGRVEDIEKACILLEQCTSFEWLTEERQGRDVATLVDDYWLKQLINKHSKSFGRKAGRRAADIFAKRLKEMFYDERRSLGSSTWRPAIEDSPQNHDFRHVVNRFVEGLRDVLAGWIEVSPDDVKSFIGDALGDQAEILRRIAIHTVTEHFAILQPVFEPKISASLFTAGHRHELYRLLHERFSNFSEQAKTAVIASLQSLPQPKGEESERRWRRTQRDWLTAIKDAGYAAGNEWDNALALDRSLGPPSEHPDFLTYHEERWGPGPTPFGADSLVAFAEEGTIIDQLHAFEERDSWRGPTLGGLIQTLEAAVVGAPNEFLPLLDAFHAARLEFQHAVLNGFKRLLATPDASKGKLDWPTAWPKLMAYFTQTVQEEGFWAEPPANKEIMIPNRDWIVTLIADFLQSGTRDDDGGYPPALLPQGLDILQTLLTRTRSDGPPRSNDPMTHAINTPKGRVVEALINHALRTCRLAFREGRSVPEAWASVSGLFDAEIAKCRDDNFEFSTLAATYIANIDFMSHDWLVANAGRMFPREYPVNFKCAIGGLAFGTPTNIIYKTLASHNVFMRALTEAEDSSHSRERMVEWVCLAYLWGDETLNSEVFRYLFHGKGAADDLRTASIFYWNIRGDKLEAAQVEKIFRFWAACNDWALIQKKQPAQLLSSLSHLASYFETLDERNKSLLVAVAPFVHSDYNTDSLIEELSRLVDTNPAGVVEVLDRMLEGGTPDFDLDDKLKKLIKTIASLGYRADAMRFVEKLRRTLPGMLEFYQELVSATPN